MGVRRDGAAGSGSRLQRLWPDLGPNRPDLRRQRRLVAPELRGHGESGWDPAAHYRAERYVADLVAVVDHFGLARFDLLGHSLGSLIAVVFAARYPERVTG